MPQTTQNFNHSELCFAKRLCRRIYLQNFASQSGLRPPHLSLRFTGQSILLRKTVYCQNFATQNRLFRTLLRKVVFDHRIMVMTFVNESCLWQPHRLVRSVGQSILLRKTVCDRPVFFGVHTLRFIARSKFSELYLILKLYEFELNNNLKNIRKAHVITHELFLYFKLWLCLCF